VRLAGDPTWRAEIRGKISALKQAVYRDRTCITALEDFLDRAARGSEDKAKNKSPAEAGLS
jgi:hypothetical protein